MFAYKKRLGILDMCYRFMRYDGILSSTEECYIFTSTFVIYSEQLNLMAERVAAHICACDIKTFFVARVILAIFFFTRFLFLRFRCHTKRCTLSSSHTHTHTHKMHAGQSLITLPERTDEWFTPAENEKKIKIKWRRQTHAHIYDTQTQ